MTEGVHKF